MGESDTSNRATAGDPQAPPPTYTIREAMQLLGMGERTIRRLVAQGGIPSALVTTERNTTQRLLDGAAVRALAGERAQVRAELARHGVAGASAAVVTRGAGHTVAAALQGMAGEIVALRRDLARQEEYHAAALAEREARFTAQVDALRRDLADRLDTMAEQLPRRRSWWPWGRRER